MEKNRFFENLESKSPLKDLSKVSGSISYIMVRSTYILLIGIITTLFG